MPNLQGVRRRIKAVRSMRQITKAMKLVSTSRLKRAQDRVTAARPYSRKMTEVLENLASRATGFSSPLLEQRTGSRVLLVLVTGDKGLCGAFNTNLIRAANLFIRENPDAQIEMVAIGRKGRDFFRRRNIKIRKEYIGITAKAVTYEIAAEIAHEVVEMFSGSSTETLEEAAEKTEFETPDKVVLIYNEFKSVIQQVVRTEQLLPIGRFSEQTEDGQGGSDSSTDYLYEQPPAEIFTRLLPRYIETQMFQALLESVASEHGSRMTAMDSASKNATEVINKLTLNMNRIRQAAITNDIIEVVSGAAAL
ncbi:MAG TPA: ATP synthase F1 subunit gamma [Acidobacteriota bacterium]|nr:ATP synthase F1 subunit gamma [Acidobacteriota bacterium]